MRHQSYCSELGFTHAELLRCLPSAVAPYVISKRAENSYAMSFEKRVAWLSLEAEKTREIGSIKLPVTAITIEFENFSEIQYIAFMNRFKKYLHRGGG